MKRFARIFIGLAFLITGIAISALLWVTRPIAEKKGFEQYVPVVEVERVSYESTRFNLPSQGVVEASKRAELSAEVSGKVVEVNPAFEAGNRFKAGDTLITIDPTDYLAARSLAAANLANAEAALATEEARAEQAERDWRKLGRGGEAPDLTLRGPQSRSARAQAESARSALAKAEKDLKRANITAPFDCVISSTRTEVGNFLVPGSPVAEVFATSPYEVRLPISVDQLPFLETDAKGNAIGEVTIQMLIGDSSYQLPAQILRSEGEIDRSNRSAYLVAGVASENEGPLALQPGLFVKATIRSRVIPKLANIPFSAFVDLDRVAVVTREDTLDFREVTIVMRESDAVYISGGLEEGERVCLTELPSMIKGIKVRPELVSRSSPNSELAEPAPKPTP